MCCPLGQSIGSCVRNKREGEFTFARLLSFAKDYFCCSGLHDMSLLRHPSPITSLDSSSLFGQGRMGISESLACVSVSSRLDQFCLFVRHQHLGGARFAIGMAKRPNLLWNFVRSVCVGLYTGQESSCWGIFLLACLKRIQAACKNLQLKYPLLGPFRLLSLLSVGGETSSFVVRMRKYNRIPRCKVME